MKKTTASVSRREPLFSWSRAALISLPFFALTMFWQAYDYTVPLMLSQHYHLSTTAYSMVMSVDNIVALIFLPLFGILSDRISGKLGRRSPLILLGTIGGIAGLSAMIVADTGAVAGRSNFPFFFIALTVTVFFMNMQRAPSSALVADCFIRPQRTKANAMLNLMAALAGVTFGLVGRGLIRDSGGVPIFTDCMIFVAVCIPAAVLVFFLTVRENRFSEEAAQLNRDFGLIDEKTDLSDHSLTKLTRPEKRSFVFILLSTFFMYMAYNGFHTHYTNYLVTFLNRPASWMGPYLLEVVLATLMMIPAAFITARLSRRRSCVVGAALCVIGYAGTSFVRAEHAELLYVWFFIAAVGFPLIGINLGPMVLELGKDRDSGRFMSYYYIATTAAQIVAPTVASFFINRHGYQIIGVYGAVLNFFVLCCGLMIRHGDAKPIFRSVAEEAVSSVSD